MGVISDRRAASEKVQYDRVNDKQELRRKSDLQMQQDHADAVARAKQKHENAKTNSGNWEKKKYSEPQLPAKPKAVAAIEKQAEEKEFPEKAPSEKKPEKKESLLEKATNAVTGKGKGKGK